MKNRSTFFLATVALACGLCACHTTTVSGQFGSGDPSLAAPNPGGGRIDPFLSDGKAVAEALDAIAQRSGKPLRITSIDADSLNGLTVNVQEPSNHANVDQFVVSPDGRLDGPKPVRIMSLNGGPITAASVDERAFDPSKLGWDNLTQTIRDGIRRSGYADARAQEWDIEGIGTDDKRFVYLESSRARPNLELDTRLKIVRVSF